MITRLMPLLRHFSKFTNQKFSSFKEVPLKLSSLQTSYARSQGPGGQNVNKVNSKAEVRINLNTCDWIQPEVIEKIRDAESRSINLDGDLIVTSQLYRQQNKNLEECHKKLRKIIYEHSLVKKERIINEFKESTADKDRRIFEKKRKSHVKELRRGPRDHD